MYTFSILVQINTRSTMDPRDRAEIEFLERFCSRTLPEASDCCSRTYRSHTLYIRSRESVVQRLTHLGDQFATTRPSVTRDGLLTELRRLRRILAHVRGKCEMAQELHDAHLPAEPVFVSLSLPREGIRNLRRI